MNDDDIKKKIKICRRHYSIITCNGEGKIMWKTLWDEVLKVQLLKSSEALCHLEKCWVAECKESKICNRQFQNTKWPPSWSSTWNYPILRIYYLSQGNLALKFANFCPFWYHGPKVRMFFFKKREDSSLWISHLLKVLPASLNTDANFLEEERASLTNNTPQIIRPTDIRLCFTD